LAIPEITITLNYTKLGFQPDPRVAKASEGQTISFIPGEGVPSGGSVRITFKEPHFFSAPQFLSGDPHIQLTRQLPHRTAYKCELLVQDIVIASGDDGGNFEP
jgi:hypothetical protein